MNSLHVSSIVHRPELKGMSAFFLEVEYDFIILDDRFDTVNLIVDFLDTGCVVTGVSVPMLWRAIGYRPEPLADLRARLRVDQARNDLFDRLKATVTPHGMTTDIEILREEKQTIARA